MTDEAQGAQRPSRLRALAPWVIAALTLAWLFHIVPFRELLETLRRAPLAWFVLLVAVHVLATLFSDSFATWVTLRRALPGWPIDILAVIHIRATTYLLAIVHYGIGQGGIAYLVHRRWGVPLTAAAGAVMLTMGVNVMLIALSAGAGIALGGAPAHPQLRLVVIALASAFPIYLGIVALRPAFLARRSLLAPLFQAGIKGHLVAAAARVPHLAVLVAGHLIAMSLFDIQVPLGRGLALLPLVFAIGNLPITPSGLGTAQAAAVALFSPYAAGATADERQAAVLAYSLSLQFLGLGFQAVVGLGFLKSFGRADTIVKRA